MQFGDNILEEIIEIREFEILQKIKILTRQWIHSVYNNLRLIALIYGLFIHVKAYEINEKQEGS